MIDIENTDYEIWIFSNPEGDSYCETYEGCASTLEQAKKFAERVELIEELNEEIYIITPKGEKIYI